jgi:frataxin-like iron-binding protein CyaY
LDWAHFGGKSPVITEPEFNALIEHTLEALEEALDQINTDIDDQLAGSVLTVEFDNETKLVFSR